MDAEVAAGLSHVRALSNEGTELLLRSVAMGLFCLDDARARVSGVFWTVPANFDGFRRC